MNCWTSPPMNAPDEMHMPCAQEVFPAAISIHRLQHSALVWKYLGIHNASLWILSCSSCHLLSCALAQSQCTLLTTSTSQQPLHILYSVSHTFFHPSAILFDSCPEAPDPWKLLIVLSNPCCSKNSGINPEISQLRGR